MLVQLETLSPFAFSCQEFNILQLTLRSSPIAYSCSHMYKITIIRNTYIEWDLTQMAPEDGTCILHYLKPRRQYLDL